jgi:hypothetical protein
MLRGGKNLELAKDQEVILVAVGSAYKTWEGGMNPETGVWPRNGVHRRSAIFRNV